MYGRSSHTTSTVNINAQSKLYITYIPHEEEKATRLIESLLIDIVYY